MKRVGFGVRVFDDLWEELERVAAGEGVSVSALAAVILEDFTAGWADESEDEEEAREFSDHYIRIDEETRRKLKARATTTGCSLRCLVNFAIGSALAVERKQKKEKKERMIRYARGALYM